jgi:hypothetical protein
VEGSEFIKAEVYLQVLNNFVYYVNRNS